MTLILGDILAWIFNHKIITLLLLIIAFGGIYHFCSSKGLQGLLERERQARSDEHQEQIEQGKTEVNQAANVSAQANENLKQSANRDSSTFDSSEAENEFCKRFKCDSSCAAWREKHQVKCE